MVFQPLNKGAKIMIQIKERHLLKDAAGN